MQAENVLQRTPAHYHTLAQSGIDSTKYLRGRLPNGKRALEFYSLMQNIAAAETLQTNDINVAISEVAERKAVVQFDVTLELLSGQKL